MAEGRTSILEEISLKEDILKRCERIGKRALEMSGFYYNLETLKKLARSKFHDNPKNLSQPCFFLSIYNKFFNNHY